MVLEHVEKSLMRRRNLKRNATKFTIQKREEFRMQQLLAAQLNGIKVRIVTTSRE